MKFGNVARERRLAGVWRDTDEPQAIVHVGVDLILGKAQRERRDKASPAPPQVNLTMTLDGQILPWRSESMWSFDDGVLPWLELLEDALGRATKNPAPWSCRRTKGTRASDAGSLARA
jgi:hypothetical protein